MLLRGAAQALGNLKRGNIGAWAGWLRHNLALEVASQHSQGSLSWRNELGVPGCVGAHGILKALTPSQDNSQKAGLRPAGEQSQGLPGNN